MNHNYDNQETTNHIFFKKDKGFERVNVDEILVGEAKGSYTVIYTQTGQYLISRNLSYLFSRLNQFPDFVRVHRSYFVNISKVDKYFKDYILIKEKEIPVSKAYRNELSKKYIFI